MKPTQARVILLTLLAVTSLPFTGFSKRPKPTPTPQQDLSQSLDSPQILLNIIDTATRDVNSRLFRLRTRSTEGGAANVGLAAAYSTQGAGLVSKGANGKETVNFKQTLPTPRLWDFYVQGDFSTTDRETVSDVAGFGGWTEAGTAGIEYNITDHLTAGFAVGYVHNHTHFANDVGSADLDGVTASLYASWFKNNFYVDGLYNFTYVENDLRRNIVGGVATASPASYGNTIDLNAGYNFMKYPGVVAGPTASLQYTHGEIDSFTDSAGLAVQSQDYNSLISEFGWQASFPRDMRCCKLTRIIPQLRAAWGHQYIDNADVVDAVFGGIPVFGRTPEPISDYAALGAGILAEFGEAFYVTLDYQADIAKDQVSQFISARGGYKF